MNTGIVVRRIRPSDYAGYGPAFAELALRALEPNPHMSPVAVGAARVIVPEDRLVILAAWLSEALGSERLVGIWALRRQRDWRSGFAAVLIAPLLPLYEVSSLPVIDRDHADDTAEAMLRHLLAASDLPHKLALPLLPLEGPTFAALAEGCRATSSRLSTYERWQRPVMRPEPGDDAERYLRRALGPSYKKRMQQFRAIARHGELSFRRLRGDAARDALPDFLALESAGWKGKAGTAIARLPQASAYLDKLVALSAAAGALQLDMLLLDGRALSMGLLVESAGTRHFLKIAYDESEARHSPGRALTIAMIKADFASTPPLFFDSGAGEEVDARTYVWGERREMANAIISLGSASPALPHLAAGLRRLLRQARTRLRR
ncbi:hypothetical protein ASE63_09980 [Bosea sp. Root381]|uniref:GNAT family N-acetyltransferase n=1 Tax=Bosea sp. Root381 TaxID=1736524 RepID=UPI0006FCA14F|nr:GNAT family N-acetyltransferase [Bosea sp. Root381]KRE00381.1 hypothetical protein ASE63_09980 [Bosea sp. Root381]